MASKTKKTPTRKKASARAGRTITKAKRTTRKVGGRAKKAVA